MATQNKNHNLIDYIITLLNLPEDHAASFDELTANGMSSTDLTQFHHMNTASEIIKLMDQMPGGFFIYYANGDEQIIYANIALLRIFQCDTMQEFRDLTGNSFKGMVHPEDLESVEKSIKEQISNSKYDLDYVEYRIIRKDGSIRWLEDYGHFVHSDSTGDIFYVFVGDATEKKNQQIEERQMITQEYLRRLEVIKGLSINYESILYVDLETDRVLPYRLSQKSAKQFHSEFHARQFLEYVSEYVNTWVHPDDRKLVLQATSPEYIREKLSTVKTYYINYRILLNGQTLYLQLRIVNVSNDRQISQIVMGYRRIDEEVLRDMEQKRMLEEALQSANLAIAAKNTFLSNMSHDMRTPLNAILGYTSLAKEHLHAPETLADYLQKIGESGMQLLNLIEKVLDITWIESNDARISETECDLRAVVQKVHNSLFSKAEEKNILLSMDLTALTHQDVYGDPDKLYQLLKHLVSNAVKYTNSGGRVDIIVSESKELTSSYAAYQLTVRDTGIGISKDFLENIFKPFEREKNTTLSGIHGSGLGLTIVKNLVDMMGGQITAESHIGKGSTFTVTLHLPIQDTPLSVDATMEDILTQLLNQKVLLVEDNEVNLEIETELLVGVGLNIETAKDGDIAVDRIAQSVPGEYGLILMDIQMPTMNGWQAATAIRKLTDPVLSRIPIIALSANAFESDKRASFECGMNAHLTKPIDIPLLLETIARVLQIHKESEDAATAKGPIL